jgi:hypothetical protein
VIKLPCTGVPECDFIDLGTAPRLVDPAPLADAAAPIQAISYIVTRLVVAVDRYRDDQQVREAFDMAVALEQNLIGGAL